MPTIVPNSAELQPVLLTTKYGWLLRRRGIAQGRLVSRSGRSVGHVHAALNGYSRPHPSLVEAASEVLNLPASELFTAEALGGSYGQRRGAHPRT